MSFIATVKKYETNSFDDMVNYMNINHISKKNVIYIDIDKNEEDWIKLIYESESYIND